MPNYVGPSQSASFGGQITSRTMGSGNPRPSFEIDLSKLESEMLREEEGEISEKTKKIGAVKSKDFKVNEHFKPESPWWRPRKLEDSKRESKMVIGKKLYEKLKSYNKIYKLADKNNKKIFYFAKKKGDDKETAKRVKESIVTFNDAKKKDKGTILFQDKKFIYVKQAVNDQKVASFEEAKSGVTDKIKTAVTSFLWTTQFDKFSVMDFRKGNESGDAFIEKLNTGKFTYPDEE